MDGSDAGQAVNLSWQLFAALLILLANSFFVAMELALVTSRRAQLIQQAEAGSKAARAVLRMLEHPDRALAASQVGVTTFSILLGIVAEEPLAEVLEPVIARGIGSFVSPSIALGTAAVLVVVMLSFSHMVVGEQTAKLIALRNPERTAQTLVYPMQAFARVTAPFVWIVDRATALLLRLIGVRGAAATHGSIASLEELKAIVQQSSREGLIEEDAQQMVNRVFEFGERVAREVMVPRPNIIGVERSQTVDDLLQIFRTHRHSRFPVYAESLDHIIGIIPTKDLLALLIEHPEVQNWRIDAVDVLQEPRMVPESRQISDLFREMRDARANIVIVIDEFGGTAGLVTLEELVEEVVGRMTDEWAESPTAEQVTESIYEIDGQSHIDEINEELQLHLAESDEYETIAGLILQELRRIPTIGQEIVVPGYKLRVIDMEGPKITKVQIETIA